LAEDSDLLSLGAAFKKSVMDVRKLNDLTANTMNQWEIVSAARDMSMSPEDVRLVKSVFDSFDTDESGTLDYNEFQQCAMEVLLKEYDTELPSRKIKLMCRRQWRYSDQDGSGSMDFREFLRWYSSSRFRDDILLTEKQRWLRDIAKKNGITSEYVDNLASIFAAYDLDNSGRVDMSEFKRILYKIMKVPNGIELPPSRIEHFWKEVDTDGSGLIEFEEFLRWWIIRKDCLAPYEGFYRQIRRLSSQHQNTPSTVPSRSTGQQG